MRLKSAIFAAALVRRAFVEGAMATIARKGAEEAGAVFVKVARLDRTADLYAPAPQSVFDEGGSAADRRFETRLLSAPEFEVDEVIAREARFDPDLWVVEIEDRAGRHFLDPEPTPLGT